ncbi:N-acyl-D-aspartate/D-glutamate deacylase [Nannocystis exedens]|uniref:N-acyl-D-aspartate/D-glutamate deacylase n=1 Tax=Nannocystis exedens TaxID=54 RepID=A0A1I2A4X4_9BACT|nr:amidohydrolase family protein [Nannocystis exedens]PCC69638.1 N-acyl-D-aspartate deacylase [Nannocystis exedens]SFE38857.1 N-acyl-D-aspartate/D-glutamate deacylase [Nannocystis exedens]
MRPRPQVLRGGIVFDGLGNPARALDVLVDAGAVAALLPPDSAVGEEVEQVDVRGCWVTPGFIDIHTHYDAELELWPALGESVRHGVTAVFLGSCGLSLAIGDPDELADMFCRVEGIPRACVAPMLARVKDWDGPAGYLQHLERLPLGPHVAALLGHSAIRAAAMGLGRSLDARVAPRPGELARMKALLQEALDAGFLGLSINTLPWDKMDGQQFRSRPTPSVFASWSEYRALAAVLRARGRVLQGVPDVSTKLNVLLFAALSTGIARAALKTTLIAMMDAPPARGVHRVAGVLTRLVNHLLGGDLRFQALPNPFDMWVDGIEVPVFEEFGAGTEALHLEEPAARAALLRDPAYRRRFRRQWRDRLRGRAYHRDLRRTRILACPEDQLVGKSFAEVAAARGGDPIDTLLDLVAEHGTALRWQTIVANDRPDRLEWIVRHPYAQIGFSDAGAHLRNMAYYNFPLRLLRMVRAAAARGRPIMSPERAVHRVTGELARWFGLDAGRLAPGARADLVVVDPEALDDRLDALHEQPVAPPAVGGPFSELRRLVRRNDAAVRRVLIAGRTAWQGGALAPELGRERFGTVLRACA